MTSISTEVAAQRWRTSTSTTAAATQSAETATAEAVAVVTAAAASPETPASSARRLMDAQAAIARAAGSRIVFDTSQVGRTPDMSSFTPSELAAMVSDKSHQFSKDESLWAAGELAQRIGKALSSFADPGGSGMGAYQRGVKQLYSQMSPDVQQALGWTPANAVASGQLISWADKHYRKMSDERFWELFTQGQSLPGAFQLPRLDLTA